MGSSPPVHLLRAVRTSPNRRRSRKPSSGAPRPKNHKPRSAPAQPRCGSTSVNAVASKEPALPRRQHGRRAIPSPAQEFIIREIVLDMLGRRSGQFPGPGLPPFSESFAPDRGHRDVLRQSKNRGKGRETEPDVNTSPNKARRCHTRSSRVCHIILDKNSPANSNFADASLFSSSCDEYDKEENCTRSRDRKSNLSPPGTPP